MRCGVMIITAMISAMLSARKVLFFSGCWGVSKEIVVEEGGEVSYRNNAYLAKYQQPASCYMKEGGGRRQGKAYLLFPRRASIPNDTPMHRPADESPPRSRTDEVPYDGAHWTGWVEVRGGGGGAVGGCWAGH